MIKILLNLDNYSGTPSIALRRAILETLGPDSSIALRGVIFLFFSQYIYNIYYKY